jgi:2-keto-4-pentenoate hydratase/2-oxohepta-3-ene-1,7-dioic acid hydratase in catechol pathway
MQLRLGSVEITPSKIIGIGVNYRAHAVEMGKTIPEEPLMFLKPPSALIGNGEPIVRPAGYGEPLVAEGELVAVIGRPARHVTRAGAVAAVLGWTIGNDVSARAWQRTDRTLWRAKNSDTFKPMGPFLVTGADPLTATTTVAVDGTVAARFPTGDMLFDPFEYICAMSRYITLRPGDVVWMGTDETADVVPGQVVEITIDGLGTLANPVVQETLPAKEEGP